MLKRIWALIVSLILSANLCGCVAVLAGTAGGVGTASWLSGKLSQEVNASFDKSIKATKDALQSLRLKMTKETTKAEVAQIMSNYTDGRTIWIDIHKISDVSSRIEIRVGVTGDKEAASKILDRINTHL